MGFCYPFKKPSCQGEKFWDFLGDDGKLYRTLSGPIDFAVLNIGWEHPELVSLTWVILDKEGKVAKKNNQYNIDKMYRDLGFERRK